MDVRLCLILQRAREAASLVLHLRTQHAKENVYFRTLFPQLIQQAVFFFFPAPDEEVLHISHFMYELLIALELPYVELPVLEVIKHDCKQAHPFIWLEH